MKAVINHFSNSSWDFKLLKFFPTFHGTNTLVWEDIGSFVKVKKGFYCTFEEHKNICMCDILKVEVLFPLMRKSSLDLFILGRK